VRWLTHLPKNLAVQNQLNDGRCAPITALPVVVKNCVAYPIFCTQRLRQRSAAAEVT